MKRKWVFLGILIVALAGGGFAYCHIRAIIAVLWAPDWVTVFSMTIFFLGCVYAIVERNFIVGFVSLGASLVLPWVKSWIIVYWPWIQECYFQIKH